MIHAQYIPYNVSELREHKDELTPEQWNYWSMYGDGTEQDFHEFANYVNWDIIVTLYNLSEQFVREHFSYINKKLLLKCQGKHLSKDFKRELRYK